MIASPRYLSSASFKNLNRRCHSCDVNDAFYRHCVNHAAKIGANSEDLYFNGYFLSSLLM
jgi:hypothetical protein